jgi:probable addiction module antidote protein
MLSDYKADLLSDLADPAYAALYLSAAVLESPEDFLLAVRDVAESRTMSGVAKTAQLNRVSMYRMLSGSGNPSLRSLMSVLEALGLRLAVEPADPSTTQPVGPNLRRSAPARRSPGKTFQRNRRNSQR